MFCCLSEKKPYTCTTELEIFEGADKNLFFKVNGETYGIVKGSLQYNDLLIYQENYTDHL